MSRWLPHLITALFLGLCAAFNFHVASHSESNVGWWMGWISLALAAFFWALSMLNGEER